MTGVLPYKDRYPRLGDEVFIAPGAWVIGDVAIGDRSSIWFNTVVRGDVHYIRIGSETNIQDNCVLHVTEGKFPLEIGNRITIGHRAIVHGCVIGDECLIGMGAIILDGARIGEGSVVAAGSVVAPGTDIAPNSLVMGIPATHKKTVAQEERELVKSSVAHYLQLSNDYLNPELLSEKKKIRGFLG
ncbi:MAG: gamma carbonic anhydrase family protein [Desulfoferrobacter sp.]